MKASQPDIFIFGTGSSCSVRLFTYLTYSSHREFSIDESHLSSDSSKGSAHNQNSQTLAHRLNHMQALKKPLLFPLRRNVHWDISHRGWILSVVIHCYFWKVQRGSPMTQICLTLAKALWISWMFGRHLSRSDLMTSLRCGWLFVMALKTLRQHKTDSEYYCFSEWKRVHTTHIIHVLNLNEVEEFAVLLINLPLLYWITYAGHANKSTSIWMIPAPDLQEECT